jgi:hypothetical protein
MRDGHCTVFERFALVCPDVAGIGEHDLLFAMKQVLGLAESNARSRRTRQESAHAPRPALAQQ